MELSKFWCLKRGEMISGVVGGRPKKTDRNEQKTSCEAYIGDEHLPGYLRIIINP